MAESIDKQRATLGALKLTPDEVQYAMGPTLSFHAQLVEEVQWYERVRRRDFEVLHTLTAIGRLLIAARITNGLAQKELADRLGSRDAQVSRDERNEYHGITVERAQRILDSLNEKPSISLESKPLSLVG